MRQINDHKINPANDVLDVTVLDEPGADGASHSYSIRSSVAPTQPGTVSMWSISFQKGPIPEAGINGVTQEALIAICIDRLRGFQEGEYRCRENALALAKLEESLMWLHSRTRSRMARGVEGTDKV